MKVVIVLVTLVHLFLAKSYKMETLSTGSFIAQLVKDQQPSVEQPNSVYVIESFDVTVLYTKVSNDSAVQVVHEILIKYQEAIIINRNLRTQFLSDGSQPIMDFYDDFYVGNVKVGTPGQDFAMALDTRSSENRVVDSACPTKGL
ncbi:Inositol hexakisphosphate and diphosphoinositol-pentakisphosphate kinase [Parelaphostrongylus tenuis]|uniref:Inositol hexakisphosphate and diphosphoinositol-pentakisphosphate kinase n=1 Tax=Parelaphostrongylus tenuis TaxID=148309 RepID=A0AAD5MNV5_PARTN|nr:Inositol hexakisphosphate and diphosphoinositol-pentakisphosphate kinase [Parelaphostrongylus tenuis]